jgi:hypothetical protein
MTRRRSILNGLLGFAGLGVATAAAAKEDDRLTLPQQQLLFSYRNIVINFALSTGLGTDIGTTDGILKGTLLQNFQFIFTSPTTVTTPSDRGLFTDIDGDQIVFKYTGTGNFITPLSDSSSPLGNLMNVGGPFNITYTVLNASGKYKFMIGMTFPGKIVATNAVNSSVGVLGAVYAEIYTVNGKSLQRAINGETRITD